MQVAYCTETEFGPNLLAGSAFFVEQMKACGLRPNLILRTRTDSARMIHVCSVGVEGAGGRRYLPTPYEDVPSIRGRGFARIRAMHRFVRASAVDNPSRCRSTSP